jgi:altronate hydrolase
MQHILKIHPKDNVLVALRDIGEKEIIGDEGKMVTILERIPAKHKVFIRDLDAGDEVIMYGLLVGKTESDVKGGSLVTTTNVKHATSSYGYRKTSFNWAGPDISQFRNKTFAGYHRSDGRVGVANYWIFIPMVFCENKNLDIIAEVMQQELGYADTSKYNRFTRQLVDAYQRHEDLDSIEFSPASDSKTEDRLFRNVNGVKFLRHEGGCGGIRQDAALLGKLLATYADHPNVGGVTVLSLGCQNLQVQDFLEQLKKINPRFDKPLYVFEQQQSKSVDALISEAIRKSFYGMAEINKLMRKPAGLEKLRIGVKCGGSDGFSGISANPAVGYCADLLVALGGSVFLAEFPELGGVEQDLIDRSVDKPTAERFIELMKGYEKLAIEAGSGFDMNPSPGNIRDGLVTDAMKSAGAARKGGSSPVMATLDYAEPGTKAGLQLACTPGNDVESTTGLTAAGSTIILFTTGLGTPTGNPICPTIKIASNSALASNMSDIIDIDAGEILQGKCSIAEMGEKILEYCISVASGEITPKAVSLNQDDFIPWKKGISL